MAFGTDGVEILDKSRFGRRSMTVGSTESTTEIAIDPFNSTATALVIS